MSELNLDHLIVNETDLATIQEILETEIPSVSVIAFGSRVDGVPRPYSDLDLALLTDSPLSLEKIAAIRDAFDSSNLLWPVDITDWATTSERFRKIIKDKFVRIQ